MALHALAGLYGFLAGRRLRWVVSAFTFACQRQGPLSDALVADCDRHGFLDPLEVKKIAESDYDGIIVTNLFGGAADVDYWTAFARERGKRLIYDSAAGFFSSYNGVPLGRFGDGEAFSFHHTKPCGVGEGGCVVVPSKYEGALRSLINFGRSSGVDTGAISMNGKLSDISAAFILDRLRFAEEIRTNYRRQWQRIVDLGVKLGFEVVGDSDPGLPSLAALAAPSAVSLEALDVSGVMLLKHYTPLVQGAVQANAIYDRVVCMPCHSEVEQLNDRQIDAILRNVIRIAR